MEYYRGLVAPEFSGRVFFTDFVYEGNLDRLVLASDIVVLLSLERYFIEASWALARIAGFGKPVFVFGCRSLRLSCGIERIVL